MLNLSGTHGTCVSCAEKIRANGFEKPTEVGRAGRGVYFWADLGDPAVAKKLAVLWWALTERKGGYDNFKRKECAVVFAEIPVEEDAFLDFNDMEVEKALNFALTQARASHGPEELIDDLLLHKVHEYVIESLEAKIGCTFDVVRARVSPPRGQLVEKIYLGNPNCYIVRNDFERIKLVHVE